MKSLEITGILLSGENVTPEDYRRLAKAFLWDMETGRWRITRGLITLVKSFTYYYILNRKVKHDDYALEYDKASCTYERWTDLMGKYTRKIIKPGYLDLQKEQVDILDLACGKGYITGNFLKLWDRQKRGQIRITAVDISERMLSAARKEIRDCRVRFILSEGLDFLRRVSDSVYDGIFFGWALPYFDHSKLIPQLARILKPGGIVFLISNREGTLEDMEDIFIELIASNPDQVARIAEMSFRLPQGEYGLISWFTGYGFQTLETGSGEEKVSFNKPGDLYRWLMETGALAGTGRIFADNRKIETSIIKKIGRRRGSGGTYSINHSFVWGIFRKSGSNSRWIPGQKQGRR